MFRIRDFSRFSRVSVKMLRHYDRLGLLPPARVDPATRYRWYTAAQLPRLHRIVALKDLGFPLETIAALLDRALAPADLAALLRVRQAELARLIARDRARLAVVTARLAELEAGEPQGLDVVLREVPDLAAAGIRQRVPDLDDAVAALFDEVETDVARRHARAEGSPMLIYHDRAYRERHADVEVAVPVTAAFAPLGRTAALTVTGATAAACAVYTGSYAQLGRVLDSLLGWIEVNRLVIAGPMREVYHQFRASAPVARRLPAAFLAEREADFVTEVQVPVRLPGA